MTNITRIRLRFAKAFVPTAVALTSVTALVGIAHTSWGRSLLGYVPSFDGCPIGAQTLDAETLHAFRTGVLRAQATHHKAGVPDVFGFKLGVTTQSEVELQLTRHDASCESALNGAAIQCAHVELGAAQLVDALHLQFDPRQRLIAIDAQRRAPDAQRAMQSVRTRLAVLTRTIGHSTAAFGSLSPRRFEQQRYSHASKEFRYSNVFAKVSATRLGSPQVLVREQYQLLD
jgi:hypothetical protein